MTLGEIGELPRPNRLSVRMFDR